MLNEISEYNKKESLWNDIWIALVKIFPFIEENDTRLYSLYKKLFYSIFENAEEEYNLSLKIDEVINQEGYYYDVYAIDVDKKIEYSLKASSPGTWVGLDIDVVNIPNMYIEDIVAYCLFEMSWFGFMKNQDFEFCYEFNQYFDKNDGRPNTPECDEVRYIENFRRLLVECGLEKII